MPLRIFAAAFGFSGTGRFKAWVAPGLKIPERFFHRLSSFRQLFTLTLVGGQEETERLIQCLQNA
jgi:hypothetical protein